MSAANGERRPHRRTFKASPPAPPPRIEFFRAQVELADGSVYGVHLAGPDTPLVVCPIRSSREDHTLAREEVLQVLLERVKADRWAADTLFVCGRLALAELGEQPGEGTAR